MVLIYTNIITHSYYYCYFDSSPNQQEKHVKICQDMSSDMTWPSHERFATRCPWAASPLAWREMSDWRWDVSWPWDVHWPVITWLKRREKYHQPGGPNQQSWCSHVYMAMDQYLLMPFLVGWTSIYQLFWCEQKGYKVLTHCHMVLHEYRVICLSVSSFSVSSLSVFFCLFLSFLKPPMTQPLPAHTDTLFSVWL